MSPVLTEEGGKTARSFFSIFKNKAMSLALVAMNFILVAYLFYSGSSIIEQRNKTTEMILSWQKETDKMMASCVSSDVITRLLDTIMQMGKKTPEEIKPRLQELLLDLPDLSGKAKGEQP